MKRQRGIAMGWLLLLCLLTLAGAMWYAYNTIDKRAYVRGKQEVTLKFEAYKAEYEKKAADARLAAAKREAKDKLDKENADAKYKALAAERRRLAADNKRLRDERARTGYLPAPEANAKRPDRATLDRAEFQRAMELIDATGARIAEEGDKERDGLNNAKRWAQGEEK